MRSLLLPNTANFLSPPENRLQSDYLDFRRSDEADRNIASWGKNMTREDVFGEKSGWVKPNTRKGGLTCFDLLYYASDKGEEVRQVYKATPPVPRGEWTCGRDVESWRWKRMRGGRADLSFRFPSFRDQSKEPGGLSVSMLTGLLSSE